MQHNGLIFRLQPEKPVQILCLGDVACNNLHPWGQVFGDIIPWQNQPAHPLLFLKQTGHQVVS